MGVVLVEGGGGDQDVVQVDEHEVEVPAHAVHQPLEGLRSVAEAEGNFDELPEAEGGDDRGLGHVSWVDADLVVSSDEVHLGEHRLALQEVGGIRQVRDRIPVGFGDQVEAAEISTGAETAVLLGHAVQRGGPGGGGAPDDAQLLHGLELLLCGR